MEEYMNEIKNQQEQKHEIILRARNRMSISGVRDVVSFDETQVELVTLCGGLAVEGRELHVSKLELESGIVELDGKVDGMYYADEKTAEGKKQGFFERLFG